MGARRLRLDRVRDRVGHDVRDMLVAQCVDDFASLPHPPHQTRVPQNPQLLRHVWLGKAGGGHDLVYEHGPVCEQVNHRHPYG